MRVLWLAWMVGGCPKPAATVEVVVPDDVPTPRTDGPLAGPRNVVDEAPPRAVDPEVPGQGPLVPYMSLLRKEVTGFFATCLSTASASPAKQPALFMATLAADGTLLDVTLRRSSDSARLDACVTQAFREATLPAPPPEAIGPEGWFQTPDMAFVPVAY